MFCVITGGSGSGKSEYAERLAVRLSKMSGGGRYYFATMEPWGEEAEARIRRHRQMRAGKGFQTVECCTGLREKVEALISGGKSLEGSCVLLECMSNLVANEQYRKDGAKEQTVPAVMEGVRSLLRHCAHLVVVTNEVFSGGKDGEEMESYKRMLGEINCQMAKTADYVSEVVCGVALPIKGRQIEKEEERGTMHLIIGGAWQEKGKVAREEFPGRLWIDGRSCAPEEIYHCGGIYHMEVFVRRRMEENPQLEAEAFVEELAYRNPGIVVVSDEIGYGLVPANAFDRRYRETVGRICTCIARRSETVLRIVCGVKTVMK